MRCTTGRTHNGRWRKRVALPSTLGIKAIYASSKPYGQTPSSSTLVRMRASSSNHGTVRALNSLQHEPSKPPEMAPPQHQIPPGWLPFAQKGRNREARAFRNSSSILAGSARTPDPQGVRPGSHWRKGARGTRSGLGYLYGRTKGSSLNQSLQLLRVAPLRKTTTR